MNEWTNPSELDWSGQRTVQTTTKGEYLFLSRRKALSSPRFPLTLSFISIPIHWRNILITYKMDEQSLIPKQNPSFRSKSSEELLENFEDAKLREKYSATCTLESVSSQNFSHQKCKFSRSLQLPSLTWKIAIFRFKFLLFLIFGDKWLFFSKTVVFRFSKAESDLFFRTLSISKLIWKKYPKHFMECPNQWKITVKKRNSFVIFLTILVGQLPMMTKVSIFFTFECHFFLFFNSLFQKISCARILRYTEPIITKCANVLSQITRIQLSSVLKPSSFFCLSFSTTSLLLLITDLPLLCRWNKWMKFFRLELKNISLTWKRTP